MKEYDEVRITVEKEKYAKYNVHKGMIGWICDDRIINEQHLVCFDDNDLDDYPIIAVKIKDLEMVREAPILKVGTKVMLISSDYARIGVAKGDKGVIIDKSNNAEQWTVRFDSGITTDIDGENLYMYDVNDWNDY